ncbi:hypothetical protein L6452_30614 [Arctium lappa]|uniref:Uncharacterized protein n=1 Tax=Arctium lappa TaxID=4217 RepID=A0ACB8ZIG6_ARCLA|nr:hypothetical protein L6452_30614 [Arctium lappa]
MQLLVTAKSEIVENAIAKFPNDDDFEKFKTDMKRMFRTKFCKAEVHKSEIRKSLSKISYKSFGINPPDFDLGISLDKKEAGSGIEKHQEYGVASALKTSSDKGSKETFSPIPITTYEDEPHKNHQTCDSSTYDV